jgi:Glycosyl hydrolase 36 superfamily, catalytic domain
VRRVGDPTEPGPRDGGYYGVWSADPPAFHLDPDAPPGDVWHQVGNDRLTATAHRGGYVVVYSNDAGLVRLSSADPQHRERQGGRWTWTGADGDVIAAAGDAGVTCTWEAGAATWTARGEGWQLTRRVWAPFGTLRALRVDIEIVAPPSLSGGTFVEQWGFDPIPVVLGGLMSPIIPPPPDYPTSTKLAWIGAFGAAAVSRRATLLARRVLSGSLHLQPDAGTDTVAGVVVLAPGRQPRWLVAGRASRFAAIPGQIVVAPLDAPDTVATIGLSQRRSSDGRHATKVELSTALPDARRHSLSYVVGLCAEGGAEELIDHVRTTDRQDNARRWRSVWGLTCDEEPVLSRESEWHAAMLRSAQVAEPQFASSYPAQGSAYGYVNGLQGAPRDYAYFMIPLCLVDPPGARAMLLTMLHMQDRDGSVMYAHTGAGHCTPGGVHHAPTDLPTSLLWAAVEYVWMTGDSGVLDQRIPWRERSRAPAAGPDDVSIRERLVLAWNYLRTGIGLGSHGLLRVGSGDWNDPISAMATNRRRFRSAGESVYNSAFSAYVLPRVARLLTDAHPEVAADMGALADDLQEALTDAWTGRWFLRAWDGSGRAIGSDRLFLDSNAWCLIARVGTQEQRQELVAQIAGRLDDPSPIGALSIDRPIRVRGGILAPGWDTNGGVWAALNALLAWGYAIHDPERALRLLRKQLLATHTRAYPGIWLGIWSGPDAYNAHYAADPGGTFIQPATPMTEFPVMNANAHAGPLLALVKTLGLESEPEGLAVRRTGALREWSLATSLGQFTSDTPPQRR